MKSNAQSQNKLVKVCAGQARPFITSPNIERVASPHEQQKKKVVKMWVVGLFCYGYSQLTTHLPLDGSVGLPDSGVVAGRAGRKEPTLTEGRLKPIDCHDITDHTGYTLVVSPATLCRSFVLPNHRLPSEYELP